MYKYTDYFQEYGRIMQFNKNKIESIHRWYPFVEGYSKEFINSILDEMNRDSLVCLEPFSGSGTTALELQNNNIICYSFEINPLMYLIASVKLEKEYDIPEAKMWFQYILDNRNKIQIKDMHSDFSTLYEGEGKSKWNYNLEVAKAIKKLENTINTIENEIYRELFLVGLAAILLDVSNLYRNGKCLSYKKNWREIIITEKEVFEKFDNKIRNEILVDLSNLSKTNKINNKRNLFNEDSRIGIENKIKDESIDLVITSPPYLNSRDYTDTYMLELRTLNLTKNSNEVRELRKKTLRSHVQIKWQDNAEINNELLEKTLVELQKATERERVWNKSILDMIRLYFVDMKTIFKVIYKKLKKEGRVYFNVSNSAYFNILINTLEICASIAEEEGFIVKEIRKARNLRTSPQQQKKIGKLLEGVIVLEKGGM